jgi:hypothetical protein
MATILREFNIFGELIANRESIRWWAMCAPEKGDFITLSGMEPANVPELPLFDDIDDDPVSLDVQPGELRAIFAMDIINRGTTLQVVYQQNMTGLQMNDISNVQNVLADISRKMRERIGQYVGPEGA